MSKPRKKKTFQKRRKRRDNGGTISKVSEAKNKRDEKKMFRIAIAITIILMIIIYVVFTRLV